LNFNTQNAPKSVGWGFATDPTCRGAHSVPPYLLAYFSGSLQQEKNNKGEGKIEGRIGERKEE